ncbi:MAG TPA: hypothetical protein VFD31_08140 [Thermoleophilaceae bacterium]|nr:hypothetical protein [Thermoleophilaceae bacterium]
MGRSPSTLRTAALIAGGALSVHELRFLIAPAGAAESSSAGHGYLPLAGFVVAVALAAALAQLAAVAGRALRTGRHEPGGPGLAVTWLAVTASIAGVFLAQEIVEAALTGRAAQGLAGVLGSGGWVAIPLAVAIGALVALALAAASAPRSRAGPSTRWVVACRPATGRCSRPWPATWPGGPRRFSPDPYAGARLGAH